jgi:hypothetical protein
MQRSAVPPPDASKLAWKGHQANALTAAWWFSSLCRWTADDAEAAASQMWRRLSFPPLASWWPEGDHLRPHTSWQWPMRCEVTWSLTRTVNTFDNDKSHFSMSDPEHKLHRIPLIFSCSIVPQYFHLILYINMGFLHSRFLSSLEETYHHGWWCGCLGLQKRGLFDSKPGYLHVLSVLPFSAPVMCRTHSQFHKLTLDRTNSINSNNLSL